MYFHVRDYQRHCSTIPVVVVGESLRVGPWNGIFFIHRGISVYNYLPYEDLKVTLVCMSVKLSQVGKEGLN